MRDRIQAIKRIVAMRNACFAAIAVSIAMLLSPLALAPVPALAQTQTVVIDCLPPWETNNRFRKPARIRHPGLSLNGFDCGDNCDIGYGFKQVLEKVYGSESEKEKEVQTVFNAIVEQAKQVFQDTSKFGHIRDNTGRLQARGFIALASYILENNDYDPTMLSPALPTAAVAVENFKTALVERKWKLRKSQQKDGVKWATPVMNIARSIDFYLALENAYKHYDNDEYNNITSKYILSFYDKLVLMGEYAKLIQDFEKLADTEVSKTLSETASSRYNLESGNASLKTQLSIGYASLTWQEHNVNNIDDINGKMIKYIVRSFSSILTKSNRDRKKHWGYQSSNGKFFWAEGPFYFHLALSQVIPFLHSARINNKLKTYGYIGDPFRDNWFLNPLHWLADVSTPDGKIPPIDDGNKIDMYNTSLLRWKSDYGDEEIGKKFAWVIGDKKYSRSALYPVEIAIPRISKKTINMNPLAEIIGNSFENKKAGENGKQEVVIRRKMDDGKQHYVLLNGESGDAIQHGEGHEQGDQMQLLYYVDDTSYLIDSGYDTAYFNKPGIIDIVIALLTGKIENGNSTWNHYYDHNVMTVSTRNSVYLDGGVLPPYISIDKHLKISDHQDINRIHYKNINEIDILSSSIDFDGENTYGQTWYAAKYDRDLLFIHDANRPYLIDINAIESYVASGNDYAMYYHGNSENTVFEIYNDRSLKYVQWNNIYKGNQDTLDPLKDINKKLHLQPFFIERPLYKYLIYNDKARETNLSNQPRKTGINIKTLQLYHNGSYLTSVAFIHALSGSSFVPTLFKPQIPIYNNKLNWQYFTRHNADTTVVDVLAVRAVNAPTDNAIHFSIPDANSFYLYLQRKQRYGFARLIKDDNNLWKIDSNFSINLKASIPKVDISGPLCIQAGNQGRYTSSRVVGGKQPYSYLWSYYRDCPDAISGTTTSSLGPKCNDWTGIETTKDINFGGYKGEDFKIRLRVTDSSSPARSSFSPELDVEIRSSAKGRWCPSNPDPPSGPDGKMDNPTEQMFALATGLLEAEKSLPEAYALRQNFPNPFNLSTEILFDLPEVAMVSLVVYDVLGREVARLVEGELPAGWHRARFNAANLPSGVYLYRIQAGDFQDTGRMLFLK